MRSEVKQRIASLRKENYSYAFIGNTLHISPNTVKSICRRNGYEAFGKRKTKAEKILPNLCKHCGRPLDNTAGQKKNFCSDKCRIEWWKEARRKK